MSHHPKTEQRQNVCNDVENGIALSTGISFLVADFCISLESYFHDLVIYP